MRKMVFAVIGAAAELERLLIIAIALSTIAERHRRSAELTRGQIAYNLKAHCGSFAATPPSP